LRLFGREIRIATGEAADGTAVAVRRGGAGRLHMVRAAHGVKDAASAEDGLGVRAGFPLSNGQLGCAIPNLITTELGLRSIPENEKREINVLLFLVHYSDYLSGRRLY
ncbi:MAG TPA: hypothetical protein V6D19_05640, partial [Stenomitos sp.]